MPFFFLMASGTKTICLLMQEIQEMQVWSLGWEDPLEEEMVTHYSILAWKVPWTEELVGHSPWACKSWKWLSVHARTKTNMETMSIIKYSVQFSSVAQSCPTLCHPMNRSTPGLPVHHQLPEFTQTHIHQVSDAIQPSHPLLSLSPPAPNPSQHQSLFQWVISSHEVAKVLEFQL